MDDLPDLGVPKKVPKFAVTNIESSGDGFDDFDFNEDHLGDSSNKFDEAEKLMKDFYKDEQEGFQVPVPNKDKKVFQVDMKQLNKNRLGGSQANDVDSDSDIGDDIEEDIQTDRDENAGFDGNKMGGGLTESANAGMGITVSQSLGVDPSVDSLALDEYDHIEVI